MSVHSRLVAAREDDPTCNLHWIGVQLGHRESTDALEDYVSELIDEEGFPRPLPHRKHGGGLSRAVSYRRSKWIRSAVLAWLADQLPPEPAAAMDDRARAEAAADMDSAALRLQLRRAGACS